MSHGVNVFTSIENVKYNRDSTMPKGSPKKGRRSPSKRGKGKQQAPKTKQRSVNVYEEDLHKNAVVWYKDEESWRQYTYVGKAEPDSCRLRDSENQESVVPREDVFTSNPSFLEGTEDLTNLTYLNEPSVLHNVQVRYEKDQIYTKAGNVLIAVNPFKQLPIYSQDVAERYNSAGDQKEAPHIFEVAQRSYSDLFKSGKSQSVVISGESGSGKTENTKFVLKQLTQKSTGKGVDEAILQTNPILEAFGNAKTLRNNNSSRFGKLINLYFDSPTQISGANIHTYLLEKSRVVNLQEGERSYHIFYQLFAGSSFDERKKMDLEDLSHFRYLSNSGCFEIAGIDDARNFDEVKNAFNTFGFTPETQQSIFNLLAGILTLGNIEFFEEETAGGDEARIKDRKPLSTAARLLALDVTLLERTLTSRIIRARNEQMVKSMDATQALSVRDALAKYIYAALFEWLVKSMNAFIGKKKVAGRFYRDVNLLDIYGFECFKVNSFEQLCINYANERLQQLFNKHLIEMEQSEYQKEDLVWKQIPYSSNDECLELLEDQRCGLISILADEINIPQASDNTLAQKLKDTLGSRSTFVDNARDPLRFSIVHYPGSVEYDVSDFLDKNRDTVHSDLVDLVSSNEGSLLWTLTESCDFIRDQYLQKKSQRRNSTIRQHAVAATFSHQLTSLIESLSKTSVHYVRCIKPNKKQIPESFDSDLVLHQLKCCGVFEVVQMARAGYPTKFKYQDFSSRYSFLLGLESANSSLQEAKKLCKTILDHYNIDSSQYQFGKSLLFLRAGALGKVEELQKLFVSSSIRIQANYRGFVVRRNYREYMSKVVTIQACVRRWIASKCFERALRERGAIITIQSNVRTFLARKLYKQALHDLEKSAQMKAMQEKAMEEKIRQEKAMQEKVRQEMAMQEKTSKEVINEDEPAVVSRSEAQATTVASQIQELEDFSLTESLAANDQDQHRNVEYEQLRMRVQKLQDENRDLRVALQQERELKLDFSEQLIVTEASYAQEFKAMKQTISTIREYLTDSMGESMLKTCAEVQEKIDDELLGAVNLTSRHLTHVDKLGREFNRKASVFDDDAEFIEEVIDGQTTVQNMDPVYELKNLKLRFEDWKDSFKRKIAYLNDCVKKSVDPNASRLKGIQQQKKRGGLSKMLGFKRKV